jgi:hypothetical protein
MERRPARAGRGSTPDVPLRVTRAGGLPRLSTEREGSKKRSKTLRKCFLIQFFVVTNLRVRRILAT